MKRLVWPILFLLAGSVLPADAGGVPQKEVRAHLEFPPERAIALADTIRVTLTIEADAVLDVNEIGKFPAGAAWTLVERRESAAPVGKTWSIECCFAPREPGEKVAFTFPPVRLKDGVEERPVTFEPIFFKVTTKITKLDLTGLHDITEIELGPPIVAADYSWLAWSALGVFSAYVIAGVILARLLFRRTAVISTAELAFQEWRRLTGMKLPEKGKSERFITLLTTLIRRYVEREFAVPARRRTTPEFLHQLAQTTVFLPEEKQFLSDFLMRSEAIKFANVEMSADECSQWSEATRVFIARRAPI